MKLVSYATDQLDLQFKVDYERQIFEKLYMVILIALRVFARNLLRGSHQRNFLSCGLTSNKITRRQLDYADLNICLFT